MTVKYFVDNAGNYIGGFEGAVPADGSIEVLVPPEDGRQVWSFGNEAWGEAPLSIPMEISDRQFFQQMAHDGRIAEQEALDAVGSGIIPAAMEALIEQLPDSQQFSARMLVRGATTFRRDHPVTALIGQLYGMSGEQIDDLWRAASAL